MQQSQKPTWNGGEYKTSGIYFGPRSEEFKRFILRILLKGNIHKRYIAALMTPEAMKQFGNAFTSELVDEQNNYQVFEQLGDLSGNKFIVGYMYRRFPQLRNSRCVKIVARLRINYGAKESFSKIAGKLDFWKYITAPIDLRKRKMKPLLEDVFEAFLGALEMILDDAIRIGVGYAVVYDILKILFDEIPISLKYEDLYDSKTRLKELFDAYKDKLGIIKFEETDFRKIK